MHKREYHNPHINVILGDTTTLKGAESSLTKEAKDFLSENITFKCYKFVCIYDYIFMLSTDTHQPVKREVLSAYGRN